MSALRIGVLLPEVLGTYADGGNALVLAERARRRGFDAQIQYVGVGDAIPDDLDIYTLGGGEDAAQELAVETFTADPGLKNAVAAGRPLLAICASLQILGHWYTDARNRKVEGLGLLDLTTRPQGKRSIGELVVQPEIDGTRFFLPKALMRRAVLQMRLPSKRRVSMELSRGQSLRPTCMGRFLRATLSLRTFCLSALWDTSSNLSRFRGLRNFVASV